MIFPHIFGNGDFGSEISSSQSGKIPQSEVEFGGVGEIENLERVASNTEETEADNGETHVSLTIELLIILEASVLSVPLGSAGSAEIERSLVKDLGLSDVIAGDETREVDWAVFLTIAIIEECGV